MLKVTTVIFTLMVCCYCIDNELVEDSRATKKKNAVRLWAMILLFVFSKVAVFKIASVMILMSLFQKIFALAGLLISYFMKQKPDKAPTMYGPPHAAHHDYNTVGYSYGPPITPETETVFPSQEYGLPTLTEVSGNFNNWLYNKS